MTDAKNRIVSALMPFDPAVNKPKDVGLGGPSTEYLATDLHPQGGTFNYPSIWWDASGNPVLLEGDAAYDQALQYEQTTGQRFPFYPQDTLENLKTGNSHAVDAAKMRSKNGGASYSTLAKMVGSI